MKDEARGTELIGGKDGTTLMKMRNARWGWCVVATMSGVSAMPASAQWTNITPDALLNGNTRGGAWIDYDKDGDLDLYTTRWSDFNLIFRNDGGDVFTAILDPELALMGSSLLSGRAVWADMDNDNDPDLFVAQSLGNRVVRNDGPGGFTTVSIGEPIELANRVSRTGAWGDYDNDGLVDLYVSTNSGAGGGVGSRLYRNDGNGQFSDVGVATGTTDMGIGRGASWVDYDGDGDLDLYLVTGSSVDGDLENPDRIINRLFRNDGGTFTSVESPPIDAPTHSRGCAWGDFDNDGDFDVYITTIRVNTGACCLPDMSCVIQSRFNCEDVMGGIYLGHDTTCDGDPCGVTATAPQRGVNSDRAVMSFSQIGPPPNGQNLLLRNDGGTFVDITSGLAAFNGLTRDASWIDADNDGDLDLFIAPVSQNFRLLRNDAGVFTVDIAAGELIAEIGSLNVGAWGDYDEDGDLDVFIGFNTNTDSALLRNDLANGNHWIQLELVGTLSNRSAIGAVIELTAGGVTQMRQIESGSSYFAQHMLCAHFGLGAETTITDLAIHWPSGQSQTVTGVSIDQKTTIVEPCDPGVDCADCNTNGISDVADLISGSEDDCNWNGVPDSCESSDDCDNNGIADFCDLAQENADCDEDGLLDVCEIAQGNGVDCDSNGIMDACELDDGFPSFVLTNTTPSPDSVYINAPNGQVGALNGGELLFDFFTMRVLDGPGPDLTVYESVVGSPEFAGIDVLISEDGQNFTSIKTTESFPPTRIPGDEIVSDNYARSYDLAGSGFATVRWVMIDGLPPQGTSNGLDLDAIGAVNQTLAICTDLDCPADCSPAPDGNGVVNIDDLLAVVNAFGTGNLDCDISPDNGDGTYGNGMINIDDLLAVVNAFGACP